MINSKYFNEVKRKLIMQNLKKKINRLIFWIVKDFNFVLFIPFLNLKLESLLSF